MENFPHVLKNVRTSSQIDVHCIPGFAATVRGMEQKLGDTGRILVRPFGTESLIRVMVEGQDESVIQTMADELCAMVSKADLG
jgi:phosphoglucosamine mutase